EEARKQIKYSYLNETNSEILIIETDITEINRQEQERAKKMQAALNAAEKANAAKSVFLSNISHDMRTPLNGIIGFTELAIEEQNFAKAKEHLAKIKLSGKLLLDLINDTLELSKIESGKTALRPVIINTDCLIESLAEIIRANADSKHQKFIVERDPLLSSYIRMDSLCMQKIFLNLLSNAVKFTPEGGTVEFRIQKLFTPVDGANCLLTVRDNGIGISKEFLPRIFDAFAQEQAPESGNAQGTGLGLAIAKKLVNLMGGKIEVESEKGKGTLFSVYLYIDPVKDYSPALEINGKSAAASLQGKNVLLVEDHPLNTELAKTLLEQKGINVKTAGNGKEAVALFSESAPDFFDAILMDIRMPVMDGLTAARCIRELERSDAQSVPIIAMTANAFDDDIRHCIEAGMNFHIAKPINPEELFGTLRKYIGR
ncbi:MAG: ATP-binding protein, partial [Fibrobacteraceae bacterium]